MKRRDVLKLLPALGLPMAFSLQSMGSYSKWGCWGLLEHEAELTSPKWQAVQESLARDLLVQGIRAGGSGTAPGQQRAGQITNVDGDDRE